MWKPRLELYCFTEINLSLTNEIKDQPISFMIWNPQPVVSKPNSIPKLNVLGWLCYPKFLKNLGYIAIVHVTNADQ